MNKETNRISIKTPNPTVREFMYVDTIPYRADALFVKRGITVNFKNKGLAKRGAPYVIVWVSVRKKYVQKFLEALDELYDVMKIMGHTDYEEFCESLQSTLKLE